MRMVGNEIYIQRGETWSLDFAVKNKVGHPFMLFKGWKNPYLAITIARSLYPQQGDYKETHWLDLSSAWFEQPDGSQILAPIKSFISTEPLYTTSRDIDIILAQYGVENGGKIVLDRESDFDITNFLFFTDPENDGNYEYAYVLEYDNEVVWQSYDFRVVKQFVTKEWIDQQYFYDIKVLSGETLQEYVTDILRKQSEEIIFAEDVWSDEEMRHYIEMITDEVIRTEVKTLYDEGVPLMPGYDTKTMILAPTKLYVGTNIQGGI